MAQRWQAGRGAGVQGSRMAQRWHSRVRGGDAGVQGSRMAQRWQAGCGAGAAAAQVAKGQQKPLAHPPEPAYPCYLPVLGEFTR